MAILDSSHVILDCTATSRDEVLELAANKVVELGAGSDAATLLEGLKAREVEGSTGMMSGFAIPHCKSASVSEPCIVVLRFAEPVEWQTMDKAPVDCAIALFIPDGELGTEHLRILSKIAASLMHEDFCHAIKGAADEGAVVAAINAGLEN